MYVCLTLANHIYRHSENSICEFLTYVLIPDLCFSVDKMISYNYKVTCTQILCKRAQNVIDDNYI